MATHYPHRAADENKQGLHYSGFGPEIGVAAQSDQSLAGATRPKIAKIGVESAKLG
jgi:hypothetical protein